jgi:hypothetical protein
MDFSVLSVTGFAVSILLIFPYAAQRSWLLHEVKTELITNTDNTITKIFFIGAG